MQLVALIVALCTPNGALAASDLVCIYIEAVVVELLVMHNYLICKV